MDNVYNTANYLSNIQFTIKNELLEYISTIGSNLLNLLDTEDRFNSEITLKIARTYKDMTLYLPVHSDWRGRIYTYSFYISYQGNEYCLVTI